MRMEVFIATKIERARCLAGALDSAGHGYESVGGRRDAVRHSRAKPWSILSEDSAVSIVAGADGCRGGWVAIVLDDGRVADSLVASTFTRLLGRLDAAAVIAVDIPIRLPCEGVRAADVAARAFVGPSRSSVLPTPPRAALAVAMYVEARRVLPSLSAQSFALGKKILEVEEALEERVFEVHPEVSFAALAGRHLRYSKRSWNGQMERRRLLDAAGIELPDELRAGQAVADDVLDAAIAAWSAARKVRGEAVPLLPDPPLQGGRPVAIWY
jgi:predicted RNase H-like nuclease